MHSRHLSAVFVLLLSAFLLLASCGRDVTASDRFQTYAKDWKSENFAAMYNLLSKSAKKTISRSDFIEKYKKIYGGIEARSLTVRIGKPGKGKDGVVPYTANLETAAGTIHFSQKARWTYEKHGDKKNWYIDWKPNMILPKMKTGDKVSVETLPAKRGAIVDRNGKPLAEDGQAAQISIVPGQLGSDKKKTINKLAGMLGVTPKFIYQNLSASWVKPDSLVPIKTIDASKTDLIKKAVKLPGVSEQGVAGRVYPDKEAAAHLTGYVGPITAEQLKKHKNEGYTENSEIGRTGLEQIFEKQLHKQDGAIIHLLNSSGEETGIIAKKNPINGQDAKLTIDLKVQDALYKEMKGQSGSAVAINPKNGDILGLVSTPSFNPNDFALGLSTSAYNKLNKDPEKPLLNRFAGSFTPGSVFKTITSAIALNNQSIDPNQKVAISGKAWQKDSSWGKYHVTRLDNLSSVNLKDALTVSDNIYFAQTALKIGGDNFVKGAKAFGFGESLPIPYPMQKSTLSNDGKLDSEMLLANTGYGQGQVSVNPLHLSYMYSALVNDGNIVKPRLVQTTDKPSVWKKNVMSAATARLLTKDLTQVIDSPSGTAHAAKINGLELAGKTGTPEFKSKQGTTGKESGWFVAFNTKNPKLLVTMEIENAQKQGGSHMVTGKVKQVFEDVLKP